jgi:hypothetical protein
MTSSQENSVPPSIALAHMALGLAESRVTSNGNHWEILGFWTVHRCEPCDRASLNPAIHPVSSEYYRIIDRMNTGEAP